jgi:transcription antitermination factor NusG
MRVINKGKAKLKIPVWRAYYVKSRHEKKASERLEEQGFEIYCPIKEVKVKWSDRWKKVKKPLIPGYLFAKVDENGRREILEDPSIFNNVFWRGEPALIRDDEIEAMRTILSIETGTEVEVEAIKPGTKIRIEAGAFKGKHGIVVDSTKKEAMLQLDSLQLQITIKIPTAALSRLKEGDE